MNGIGGIQATSNAFLCTRRASWSYDSAGETVMCNPDSFPKKSVNVPIRSRSSRDWARAA
jgi:hypothetical protein